MKLKSAVSVFERADPWTSPDDADWFNSRLFEMLLPNAHTAMASVQPVQSGASESTSQVLYLKETGDKTSISPKDIFQGGIGDCFFLACVGEIALTDPGYIEKDLIHTAANSKETVTLYEGANHRPIGLNTTSFIKRTVTVANSFPSDSVDSWTTHDTKSGKTEIWPQVMEKAYAELNGGYDSISNGGYDLVAMEALTGKTATYVPIEDARLSTLEHAKAHTLITFDTPDQGKLGYGLVNDHAYMFDRFVTRNNHVMVDLLNPWGTNEPKLVPWSSVTKEFEGLNIGHV